MGGDGATSRKTNNIQENKHCFETTSRLIRNKQDHQHPSGHSKIHGGAEDTYGVAKSQ